MHHWSGNVPEFPILEIKQTNFGNQNTISEIKHARQELNHKIILVILLEHHRFLA